jgi:hypothetical protein
MTTSRLLDHPSVINYLTCLRVLCLVSTVDSSKLSTDTVKYFLSVLLQIYNIICVQWARGSVDG